MHRLFTATAILASTLLIAQSSDARPAGSAGGLRNSAPLVFHSHTQGGGGIFNDGGRIARPSGSAEFAGDAEITLKLATNARIDTVRWAPGIESRNVRVLRMSGGGSAKGEPRHGALQVLKSIDKATPLLRRALESGRALPKVVLKVRNTQSAGGKPVSYLHYEMKNVRVRSIGKSPGRSGSNVSLTFGRLLITESR